ncbi:MAG: SpoIIE family protein phosphatase [Candidatus Eisenbacteria bacterium]|uniref:SpoIIE family protein phosphatase n=1 Tax=Eiseniibacteriota bacterium TaxID=2212470 RepID=A0A9D6L731_UNCEI|nr:SpoIIE family protein phosphatase [Candidatus Eisenbacteria bacterium]
MRPFLLLATLNLCLGGLVFLLGLLILRENPRQRLNRVVALMLFFGGFGSVLAALSFLGSGAGAGGALAFRGAAPAGGPEAAQNFAYLWEFFFPTLFMFASIFPVERVFARRGAGLLRFRFAPSFAALIYAPHVFHFIVAFLLATLPGALQISLPASLKPLAPVAGLANLAVSLFLAMHRALFSLVNLGFGIAAIVLLADSYRRARAPRLRQQLRAIGLGLASCLVLYSFASLIPALFNLTITEWARSALTIAALTVGSGSIAYAMVRYKFLDAKLLARRGILYGVASALLVGVYLTVVVQLNRLLTQISGVDARVIEPVFLIVALIVFQPAISWLEQILDRLLLRDPGDYRNVLRQLGRDLQTTIELDDLLERSIRTIAESLLLGNAYIVALPRGGVIVRTGAGAEPTPDDETLLPDLLGRLPSGEESFRLSDPIPGLTLADRGLLVGRLGTSLLFPLHSRGETVGALLLGDKVTATEYTSEDVNLLSALAGQLSVSLQNALLVRERVQVVRIEEELRLARQIQRSFLLSEFPTIARFDVHALNIPSKEVGGDFYDLVPTGNDEFVLAIADVAGKGVPAALLSSMLQASLRTQAGSIGSVAEILRNINSLVYRATAVHQFATFFIARVDHDTLQMTFSNAGHNYPMVIRRGHDPMFLERGGLVLGIQDGARYEEERLRLATGDLVVLYTDGISEASSRDGEFYGEARLCDLVRSLPHGLNAREVTEHILGALRAFLDGEEPRDDMTLMVLRVLEPEPAPRADGAGHAVSEREPVGA